MAEPLEIHVFGGAIGESIVLGLPGRRWAIIDVYLSDLLNPSANPVIAFLEQRGVKDLQFLCLTHPHSDHVRGISHLIKHYRVRRFLGFGSLPPQKLYNQIVKVLKTKAKRLHDNSLEEEIASELLDTLDLINQKVKRREMSHDPVSVGYRAWDEELEPEKLRLRITAIAPSGRSISVYNAQLSACFDKSMRGKILADQIEGVEHNAISSAFIVEYGSQRLILGGDVEASGWEDVIRRSPGEFHLLADLIKVSHHGSENGYCAGLWEQHLSPRKKAVAVVTAFSPKALPGPKGVAFIQGNCRRLVTTSISALKPKRAQQSGLSPFNGIPLDAQVMLRAIFKNALATSTALGCCSFTFDGNAAMTETLSGDAGEIVRSVRSN